jgi:hypothetical protein
VHAHVSVAMTTNAIDPQVDDVGRVLSDPAD